MNKKKVKELIEQILKYCDQCYNPNWQPKSFEEFVKLGNICREAIKELSKSDWISVEDWLPPYEQNVEVRSTEYPNDVWTSFRRENVMYNHDFVSSITRGRITHWKPIEKLEE